MSDKKSADDPLPMASVSVEGLEEGRNSEAKSDPEERYSSVYDDTRERETKTAEELEAERKKQVKKYFSFCGGFGRGLGIQLHKMCLVLSILVWLFLVLSFANPMCLMGFVIFYILYTIEYCNSSSSVFIRGDIISSDDYLAYMTAVKAQPPALTHEMECTQTCSWVEYVEVTHNEPGYTDSNGQYHCGSSYTTTEKVHRSKSTNYCTDREAMKYNSWYDRTENVQLEGIVTKLYSEKAWYGNNDRTCSIIDDATRRFKARHNHKSHSSGGYTYTYSSNYKLRFEINGLVMKQIVSDEADLPFWLSNKRCVYNTMNLFALSWLYRVWFSGVTGRTTVNFEKILVIAE